MRQGTGSTCPGQDPSGRRADEARLSLLLERTYAAREARITPADDALAKLNAALDAIGSPSRRRVDHRRLFGACALAVLLLVLLSPVARSEFSASTRNAARSVVMPMNGTVGDGVITGTANGRAAISPVAIAVRAADHTSAANGTAPMTGVSETPLRDLLARAGIHASDPPGVPSTDGHPPQH